VLDTDFETAQFLKIPAATEAPFSPITEKTRQTNLAMISKASMVVLTSVPFGYGNLQNLEAAKEALEKGIPVFVLNEVPIESRDFTQGRATALFDDLKAKGATFVKDQTELLSRLNVSEEKLGLAKEGTAKIFDHLKPGEAHKESDITRKHKETKGGTGGK
jgi:iron complex transport system ATP-binding protein